MPESIGMIDVDGHSGFPNLAQMKISAYHKLRGDNVEWWDGFKHYDKVYMSKVFTFSPDVETIIDADKIVRGGTGYKDYTPLPDEIENIFPDYSLYPHVDYAVGFLTRGCIRSCPWCIVPRKEGKIRANQPWEAIKRPDSRKIVFMDNNVLASSYGVEQIGYMGGEKVWVDFNQGLDARLITPEIAEMLSNLRWIKFIRMACDTSAMLPVIEQAVAYLREAGVKDYRFWSYALIQDVEEAYKRIQALRDMGVTPFAQPYIDFDGGEPTEEQKRLARWCNNKAVFKTVQWEEYGRKCGREADTITCLNL